MAADDIPDKHDRPRGITPADRAYLTGDRTYKHKETELNRLEDIRERTKNAIIDFTLLFDELSDDQLEKIFGDISDHPDLYNGARDTLAFILYGTGITRMMGSDSWTLAVDLLEEAYKRAGYKSRYHVTDVERPQIKAESLRNSRKWLEEGEDISARSIALLLQSEDVDLGPYREQLRRDVLGEEQ